MRFSRLHGDVFLEWILLSSEKLYDNNNDKDNDYNINSNNNSNNNIDGDNNDMIITI